MQIWDLCMLKMSDTGNHSESYPIPSSYETIGLDVQDDVKNKLYPLKIQLRQKPVQCTGCSISLPYPKKGSENRVKAFIDTTLCGPHMS